MPARRVLIVDDNELNLRLAETILTHAGFAITVARTAQEARGELAGGSWDALLVDLRLPDGDGMEIVRRLRARPETATMRIAALTASPVTGDARLALEAGCDVAITKPLEVR